MKHLLHYVPNYQLRLAPLAIAIRSKQYLRVDQQYTLNLSYNGDLIYTLSFKTLRQQSDPRYVQEVNNEMARDYPLATKLPYESPVFTIRYSSPLTLEITVKNPNLTTQEIIDEVKVWVTQNGGDTSAHKYVIAP